jgi:3-isopropylmalate dehydratase small subunit/anti-anti-sigma regulatory factor
MNGHGTAKGRPRQRLIAAITSCTNTSNPSVMLAAGLLAKKAVERGLKVNPAVKSSLAPGSRVVTDYLTARSSSPTSTRSASRRSATAARPASATPGPLAAPIEEAITKGDLVAASVLSGNRNFEARVHQSIKANFLMSPPLVVAFALAGRVDIDMSTEPLGKGSDGKDVFLKDIWPTLAEVRDLMQSALKPEVFRGSTRTSRPRTRSGTRSRPRGDTYAFDPKSTYIQEPPFFAGFSMTPGAIAELKGARALGIFGDSVTTDHISPAGSIKKSSPAGKFLLDNGVAFEDFNSYGSRRGNDRVMTRGTFANVRIKNLMLGGEEGGNTLLQPEGTKLSIFDAAAEYKKRGTPLVILAGQEYGTGSSRDWAAKGTNLLGVKAVVAQSFERIHRSNLVGMGVLPLQFKEGTTAATLKLDGSETYDVLGLGQASSRSRTSPARHPQGRRNPRRSGALPDRYPHRDRLLPARRDPPLRPPANPRHRVISEAAKPVYLVDAYSDPVVIRIEGRACFLNSACLRDFVNQMLKSGKTRFVIDFLRCTSMDSTFLGVLAGFALELRKTTPKGSLILTRMGQRNLELIRNLGLHKLLTVDSSESGTSTDERATRRWSAATAPASSRTPGWCSRPTRTWCRPTRTTAASSRTCSFS